MLPENPEYAPKLQVEFDAAVTARESAVANLSAYHTTFHEYRGNPTSPAFRAWHTAHSFRAYGLRKRLELATRVANEIGEQLCEARDIAELRKWANADGGFTGTVAKRMLRDSAMGF